MKNIEITTERLKLEPLGIRHLETTNLYALDPEITKYMCFKPHKNEEETLVFLTEVEKEWKKEKPAYYEFAILFDGRHIGGVSIYDEDGKGELGWILQKDYQGRGFACEAAAALIQYFSEYMGTTHFIAHCDTRNIASYKVMEKLGMTRVGEPGRRRNRASAEDSLEYCYEKTVDIQTCISFQL